MTIPRVTIIIVTYNGSRYIKKCLTSVFANKYAGEFDVIVVDNASSDDTVKILEQNFNVIPAQAGIQKYGSPIKSGMIVSLIQNDANVGFVGGNNISIKRALERGSDYAVLLNQDTEVEYDWLEKLVSVSESDEKIGIVQSMLLLAKERAFTNNVGNALHYLGFGFIKHYHERVDSWYHRAPFEIGYASGAAMLIKREVLEKLSPPFDPKFFAYHEDLDLCWRARLLGYKIMIAPQAVVYHHYQFNRNKKMFYWTERNRWACLLQNYSARSLMLLAPVLISMEAAMLVYSLITGWFWEKIKSYLWVIFNLIPILSARSLVQRTRKATDKEIFLRMDSAFEFQGIKGTSKLNFFLNGYYRLVKRLI